MVDADLQTATTELAGEFEGLDIRSMLITGLGIGMGLFSAEFFAEITGNMFGGQSAARTVAVEIATKFGVSAGAFLLRRFIGGPLIGALLILAAVGASTSGILQIFELLISMAQEGEVGMAARSEETHEGTSDQADIDQAGYDGDSAEVSV